MNNYSYKISYLDKTNLDFDMICGVTFNGSTSEESSFLSLEAIYAEKYDGSRRYDFGAKYNEVAEVDITFIKKDSTIFTQEEITSMLRWLTRKHVSWIKLYNEDEELIVMYLGRFTRVLQEKMDANTIGLVCTFTSVSPFGYSDTIENTYNIINSNNTITINNPSDDFDSYVYPLITIKPSAQVGELSISNLTNNESLIVKNIGMNETITIDNDNKIISSDNSNRVIGTDFVGKKNGILVSYPVWFRLSPGGNNIKITYDTSVSIVITTEYRVPLKVGAY